MDTGARKCLIRLGCDCVTLFGDFSAKLDCFPLPVIEVVVSKRRGTTQGCFELIYRDVERPSAINHRLSFQIMRSDSAVHYSCCFSSYETLYEHLCLEDVALPHSIG